MRKRLDQGKKGSIFSQPRQANARGTYEVRTLTS
jgi:hypothetical protein